MLIYQVSSKVEQSVNSRTSYSAVVKETAETNKSKNPTSKALLRKSQTEAKLLEQAVHQSYESSIDNPEISKRMQIFERGCEEFERGNYNVAAKLFNHMIEKDASYYDESLGLLGMLYTLRGNCHAFLGEYSLAISDYTKILSMPSVAFYGDDFEAQTKLCRSMCYLFLEAANKGNPIPSFDEPISCYGLIGLEELANQGNHIATLLLLKEFPEYAERWDDEIDSLSNVLPLESTTPCEIADICFKKGNYKGVVDILTPYLETPDFGSNRETALRLRATSYAMLGNFEAAVQDCDEFIELYSIDKEGYIERALIHHCMGNKAAALSDLRKAEEDIINYPEAKLIERLLD